MVGGKVVRRCEAECRGAKRSLRASLVNKFVKLCATMTTDGQSR
jgi:hypothetical protein